MKKPEWVDCPACCGYGSAPESPCRACRACGGLGTLVYPRIETSREAVIIHTGDPETREIQTEEFNLRA